MTGKVKLRIGLAVVFLAGVAGIGLYFLFPSWPNQDKEVVVLPDGSFGWKFPIAKFPSTGATQVAYSDIRDPGGIPQGLPVRLIIPIIGVDSAIEDALITPDGRMDVPAGSVNVAWFSLGPHPGDAGSAVIGGHFGIKGGVPFVFYKLDHLKIGDKIHVVNDKGDVLIFMVREISLFDRNADATAVFASEDGFAHLNLITCEGVWNRVNNSYPERRVVFTDLVSTNGSIAEPVFTFRRSLGIGAKGADVVALQTMLQGKGFLAIPPGVDKGFFGPLTSEAVSRYQASVGLPQVGVFGPLTRAKLISDGSPVATKPTFPSTAIVAPELPSALQVLIRSTKGLYSTPIDALTTILLLVLIVFVAFKIFKR
ncbi:MAG: sortase [Patescibacteria group bacterium]